MKSIPPLSIFFEKIFSDPINLLSMDFEKFLNDDITTLSEEIVTFFGQPLTPEVLEEYPVHMLVTEFLGHHEDVGDFEAIEKLQQTLIDHNSDFFQQVKGFFVNYLVKYYCFKQDAEKVEHYLNTFTAKGVLLC